METSNPGILRVPVEVGSVSLIFPRVGGISARILRYDIRPLYSLGPLHVNKVSGLGTQAAAAPNRIWSELRTLRKLLWKIQPIRPVV